MRCSMFCMCLRDKIETLEHDRTVPVCSLEFGLKKPKESKVYKLAQKYNAESKTKGKLSVNKVYNLVKASENFVNDRLVQLGEKNNSLAVAGAVVKKLSGIELSLSEMELLTKNSYGQEVLKTIVPTSENADTVDNGVNNEYNNDTRGEEYARTDEFRSLQAESQGMSDEDIQLYRSGSKQLDDEIRGNIARVFRSQINAARNGVRNDDGLLKLESKGNNFDLYENVNGTLFRDVFEISRKYLKNGELVDLHTVETTEDGIGYNDCYNYLSEDGLSGFSITPDGDLISVFNASGKAGFLGAIAPIVKERAKTLDCYNSQNQPLRGMYEKIFGFKTASIMDYNMEYDHDNIAENHGTPKIAFMVNTESDVETKEFSKDEYDEAVGYRDGFIEKADPHGAANFMPEGENAPSVTSGDSSLKEGASESGEVDGEREIGLSDPTDQEIYRDPTDEENAEAIFGKRKNAKQRHILDVAKKLDSNMRVIFVSENAKVLSGKKGVYMRESNTVYLSEGNSVVESYYQVFKHEFIHRLESKGAYQSFKNYLFRHSTAFEQYARAQLGKDFKGTREEVLKALEDHYMNTVKKGDFSEKYKKSFIAEDAQREMVADFISEILFKGDRADVAQHLSDSNLDAVFKIEDTLSEFENLTETDRNWFQKIIDTIKDFIASLKGVKQNERLVKDLEYIEQRLSRVLDSRDTKKAASRAANKQFSLKIKHTDGSIDEISDARNLTEEQAVNYLWQAKRGELQGHSYIPIRKDTPQVIIDTLEGAGEQVENLSLVMQVHKAQQSMSPKNNGGKPTKHGSNVRKHALSPNEIVEIINNLDNPNTIILQTNRYNQNGKALPNNVAIFVEYSNNGKEGVAVVEFDSAIDSEFIGTEFGDTNYHTAVTVFEPDTEREGMPFDYVEELLENPDNFELKIERRQPAGSATQEKHPNTSSELPSINSVPHEEDTVNSNSMQETEDYSDISEETMGSFSLGSPAQQMRDNLKRYENGEITQEEYREETDRLWGEANETYGTIPQGEKAKLNMPIPSKVDENKPTERFVRTIVETDALTGDMLEGMEERVLLGGFAYEEISDEKAMKKVDSGVRTRQVAPYNISL